MGPAGGSRRLMECSIDPSATPSANDRYFSIPAVRAIAFGRLKSPSVHCWSPKRASRRTPIANRRRAAAYRPPWPLQRLFRPAIGKRQASRDWAGQCISAHGLIAMSPKLVVVITGGRNPEHFWLAKGVVFLPDFSVARSDIQRCHRLGEHQDQCIELVEWRSQSGP
jgi:hypothetical protein